MDRGPELAAEALEGAAVRHLRLERIVAEELDGLLRNELVDPALEGAVVGVVALTADARGAQVRVRVPAGRELHAAQEALNRAAPRLRHALSEALELKHTPTLVFRVDVMLEDEEVGR